ncbi:unnamed protein product, partial [Gongylonema pulchrum]|uniref:Uncharacterized protein n=1 Tax=Gongylonema pulchrum TaxID=637853 RepID=A0A183E2H7_9BILA
MGGFGAQQYRAEEVRFLEVWDRVRKRSSYGIRESSGMLENLKQYYELAKRTCPSSADRELYEMVYCVLHEKLVEKANGGDESRTPDKVSSCASDSGYGSFYSCTTPPIKVTPEPSLNLELTPQRRKLGKRRSRKINLPDPAETAAVKQEHFSDLSEEMSKKRRPYPILATAL